MHKQNIKLIAEFLMFDLLISLAYYNRLLFTMYQYPFQFSWLSRVYALINFVKEDIQNAWICQFSGILKKNGRAPSWIRSFIHLDFLFEYEYTERNPLKTSISLYLLAAKKALIVAFIAFVTTRECLKAFPFFIPSANPGDH